MRARKHAFPPALMAAVLPKFLVGGRFRKLGKSLRTFYLIFNGLGLLLTSSTILHWRKFLFGNDYILREELLLHAQYER